MNVEYTNSEDNTEETTIPIKLGGLLEFDIPI